MSFLQRIWVGLFTLSVVATCQEVNSSPYVSLYLQGGPGGIYFDLGVLQGIEKFKIPIREVVASNGSSWVAGLWAEGYTIAQIKKMWEDGQQESLAVTAKVSEKALIGGESIWSFDSLGQLQKSTPIQLEQSLDIARSLHLQQAWLARIYFPQSPTKRVPWSVVLCDASTGVAVQSTANPDPLWIFRDLSLVGSERYAAKLWTLDSCQGILPSQLRQGNAEGVWITANSWPLRALENNSIRIRSQQRQLNQSKDLHWISVAPHSLSAQMSPESLQVLGYQSVRARLGDLRNWQLQARDWSLAEAPWMDGSSLILAFDQVPAEEQQWIYRQWQNGVGSTGILKEILHHPVYDSAGFQFVGTPEGIPQLLFHGHSGINVNYRVQGWGNQWIGPHAGVSLKLQWISQFHFALATEGKYGQDTKAWKLEGNLLGIAMPSLSVHAVYAFSQENHQPAAQRDSLYSVGILEAQRHSVNLGASWLTPHKNQALVNFTLRDELLKSQQSLVASQDEFISSPWIRATTMYALVAWKDGENQGPVAMQQGFHYNVEGGGRSTTYRILGNASVPLYVSGKAIVQNSTSIGHVGLGGWLQAGLEGRLGDNGWEYPQAPAIALDGVQDEDISRYFELPMDAGFFTRAHPSVAWNSAHFLLGGMRFSYTNSAGDGFWILSSLSHDYVQKLDRLTIEPLLRLTIRDWPLYLGAKAESTISESKLLFDPYVWTLVFQVGNFSF